MPSVLGLVSNDQGSRVKEKKEGKNTAAARLSRDMGNSTNESLFDFSFFREVVGGEGGPC